MRLDKTSDWADWKLLSAFVRPLCIAFAVGLLPVCQPNYTLHKNRNCLLGRINNCLVYIANGFHHPPQHMKIWELYSLLTMCTAIFIIERTELPDSFSVVSDRCIRKCQHHKSYHQHFVTIVILPKLFLTIILSHFLNQ